MILCVYALTSAGRDAKRFLNVRRDAKRPLHVGRAAKRPANKSRARTRGIGVRGLASEPLRLIEAGRVAAIVGEMPRRPAATIARARRYDQVVRAIGQDARPVLPARFGTFFRSIEELERALLARERPLVRALSAVRGRVQMVVRVPDASPGTSPAAPPTTRASASGAEYLRARAADLSRARHVAGFDPVRAAARQWIRDEAVEKRGRVASVYHLIPRASAPAYTDAIRRAASEAGVRVVVTGPMPAYAFADLLLAPGGR
jgi:hypothetical protein